MNRTIVRRLGAVSAGALVAAGLSVAGPAGTAQAAEADPAPAAAGADWLAGQLTDGLLFNPNFGGFNDFGLSIDAGLALAAVGGQEESTTAIADAIADNVDAYTTGGPLDIYAGSTAKALSFLVDQGFDAADVDGVDLLERLEERVATEAPIAGRIEDAFDPESQWGADYANTIGQAFAARALSTVESDLAGSVTDFLLDQQCEAGFFRLQFTADKTADDQTCDGGPPAAPAADTTALVVTILHDLAGDDAAVAAAMTGARDWLLSQQAADGSFPNSDEGANTNTTGLAGWALGEFGEDAAASRAAAWVRLHQASNIGACGPALAAQAGAIAFNAAAYDAAGADGIPVAIQDQWRRATAQATPALQWAPAAAGAPSAVGPVNFRKAGDTIQIRFENLAPGQRACLQGPGPETPQVVAGAATAQNARVKLPAGTGERTYTLRADGAVVANATVTALGKRKLGLKLRNQARKRGKVQRVVVDNLVAGERVTVLFRGKRINRGEANANGRYATTFRVRGKLGNARVVVRGQFPQLRKAADSFRVRR